MIHVIIPVHNRIELTLKCITSLIKQENSEQLNIFVVDDGSTDETSKILPKKFPNVNLIKGTGSLFWCGAVNFGIDHVLKIAEENDWILLVNNDGELKSDGTSSLADCGPGTYTLMRVREDQPSFLQWLAGLGLMPGTSVCLTERNLEADTLTLEIPDREDSVQISLPAAQSLLVATL